MIRWVSSSVMRERRSAYVDLIRSFELEQKLPTQVSDAVLDLLPYPDQSIHSTSGDHISVVTESNTRNRIGVSIQQSDRFPRIRPPNMPEIVLTSRDGDGGIDRV